LPYRSICYRTNHEREYVSEDGLRVLKYGFLDFLSMIVSVIEYQAWHQLSRFYGLSDEREEV
jgi:hypothetical protein